MRTFYEKSKYRWEMTNEHGWEVSKEDLRDNKINQVLGSEKTNIDWTRDKYKLTLYDFSNNLYFAEAKGTGGYTMMSKKNVGELMELVSTIDFGKETLLTAKTIDELIQ